MSFELRSKPSTTTTSTTMSSHSRRKLMPTSSGGSNSNSKRELMTPAAQGLRKRDIEFMHHAVTVLKKMGEFGTSYLYTAKDDAMPAQRKSWRGTPVVERNLLIKATTASTKDEVRRAEAEVKLLRRLRHHPTIPTLIDCGFSTFDDSEEGDESSPRAVANDKRLYCMLFEPCPDYLLSDFLLKQRRKLKQAKPRGFLRKLARKANPDDSGYIPISTVLDIFWQMCEGIKELHNYRKRDVRNIQRQGESRQYGILHLDVCPGRFVIHKVSDGKKSANYEVQLCSFGCAYTGSLSIRNDPERRLASIMLDSVTTDIYRAPEMVNFQLSDELTDKCDIWGLGCCFYNMLFLRECFKDSSKLTIMNGRYKLPQSHPYELPVLDLLDRMLTVMPENRPSIEEVIECILALQNGVELPARRMLTMQITGTTRNTYGTIEFLPEGLPNIIELDSSQAPEDNVTEEQHKDLDSYTHYYTKALSDSAALTLCRSDTTGSSALGGSLPDFGTGADEAESDDTHWLEFQPGHPNNTARRISEPTKQRKAKQKLKRRAEATGADPLSLGNVGEGLRKNKDAGHSSSEWELGVLTRLSTKSLNPIEPDKSDRGDEGGFTVVKPPSNRGFNLKNLSARTKRSGRSVSTAAASLLEVDKKGQNFAEPAVDRPIPSPDAMKKDLSSSANTNSGDDSAWFMNFSVDLESASNLNSDSDMDDAEKMPCDFMNASTKSLQSGLQTTKPEEVAVESVIVATNMEPTIDRSIRSLDVDKSVLNIAIKMETAKDPSFGIIDMKKSFPNKEDGCDDDTSRSRIEPHHESTPYSSTPKITASISIAHDTYLRDIREEPQSPKTEDDESAAAAFNISSNMLDIPIPENFQYSAGDGNSAPFIESDDAAEAKIDLDKMSLTRRPDRVDQGLEKVVQHSLRSTSESENRKTLSKKMTSSPQIPKAKLGQNVDLDKSTDIVVSPVSFERTKSSGGSRSTWDEFSGGKLEGSLAASKENINDPLVISSRSTGASEVNSLGMNAVEKNGVDISTLSQLPGMEAALESYKYSSPTQWAASQRSLVGSQSDKVVATSKKSPASLVEVEKKKVSDTRRKSDPVLKSHGPSELTTVEDHMPMKQRGSLDCFLARENALAEFQELVKYTEVKKELIMECKVSVGTEDQKKIFVLSDSQRRRPSHASSPHLTTNDTSVRIGGSRSAFSANELMTSTRSKSSLQNGSHRLKEFGNSQGLVPADDEGASEPRKTLMVANLYGMAQGLAPTQSTMHREESKMTLDSKTTLDSNLPPLEGEACAPNVSRPPEVEIQSPDDPTDTVMKKLDLLDAENDPESDLVKFQILSYNRFQRSKCRLTDEQTFSKLFSLRGADPDATPQPVHDEIFLDAVEPLYSDEESDFGIPLEIQIIPDQAFSSLRNPKTKRKKLKGSKKEKRKNSKSTKDNDYADDGDRAENTHADSNFVDTTYLHRKSSPTLAHDASMHSLPTRKN